MAGSSMFYYRTGLVTVVPDFEVVAMGSGKRTRNKSFETQNTTKTIYKDYGGGCSSQFTKINKAGDFVDKRNGKQGFKEEVKYKSSFKVNDKIQGCTTEYQTQVKVKKATTYKTPTKKTIAAAPRKSGPKWSGGNKKSSSGNKVTIYNTLTKNVIGAPSKSCPKCSGNKKSSSSNSKYY